MNKITERAYNIASAAYPPSDERHLVIKDLVEIAQQKAIADAAPRWIPVAERLPPRRVPVLVFGMYAGDQIITDERWDGYWYEHSDGIITHWMPLPAAPEQEATR